MTTRLFVGVSFCVSFSLAGASHAQSLDLSWYSIDGGGGASAPGGIELAGTLGQTDAGSMVGGAIELSGGFWAAFEAIRCPGDVNGDRVVDLSDLATLLSRFGNSGNMTLADGDLDGDGDVDLGDLSRLLSAFGTRCS